MVKTYLDDLYNPLIFSPYCRNMIASFRFYPDTTEDASPFLHYTFSNLGDLQDQLYYFWLQLIYLLKRPNHILKIIINEYLYINFYIEL